MKRRTFLQVAGGLSVLPAVNGLAAPEVKRGNKKVVYIYLGGGPSQYETFHDTMEGGDEYRPVHGVIKTNVEGIRIAAHWNEIAKRGSDFTFVRSLSHSDADHSRATCYMQTGSLPGIQGDAQKPSIGSVISKELGPSAVNGLPLYVRNGRTEFDGAAWLGAMYNPFDANGDAKKNFMPIHEAQRLAERGMVLEALDKFNKSHQRVKDLDSLKKQAFDIILGECRNAFAIEREPQPVRDAYGKGTGENFLLARRLLQFGARFVQIHHGGWDMHSGIAKGIDDRVPELDRAIGMFIDDLKANGMFNDTLIMINGDFGRTKLNKDGGRDHFPRVSPLAFAGGGYNHGNVIGETDKNATDVVSGLVKPQDIVYTILKHFGIPTNVQYNNHQGRPIYIVENAKSII